MKNLLIEELHADSLWVAALPFRFKGIDMGARMTIVRLSDNALFIVSPLDLSPQMRTEIESLGAVRVILAPNRFHYLCLHEYSNAFPDAKIFVAPGVKAGSLQVSGTLGDQADSLWSDVLDQTLFQGNKLEEETVFFHRVSRTLIVTDLCFNLRRARTPLQRISTNLLDINGKFGSSRLSRILTRDRKAARASLERVLHWDFDRVIMAHGDVLQSGGKTAMQKAFRWL
jgi:hypothetical protein